MNIVTRHPSNTTPSHRQKRTVRRHHEPAGRPSLDHRPEATPDHHRRLGACRAVAPRITRSVRSGRRARSCLTPAGHRPAVWPHEIPDSGISHRSTGSSPRSGTEAGDISPVFAALEHAAGDFTTLGTNPSDTLNPHERPFTGMLGRHPRSASGRGGCSLSSFSLGGPPFLVPVSAVLADDDGRRVVVTGTQGPAIRVVSQDDAVGAELVDQDCRIGRAGYLS